MTGCELGAKDGRADKACTDRIPRMIESRREKQ